MPRPLPSVHPTRVAEAVLWTGAVAGAGLAAIGWRAPAPAAPPVRGADVSRRRALAVTLASDAVATAADTLAAHDPFRLTHRPALVAYGAPEAPPRSWAAAPVPAAGRPRLTVQGFVGGRSEWSAVLGGVPGRDGGVLVRAGDTLGSLRVRRVVRDTLVVAGADTVWRLTAGATGNGPPRNGPLGPQTAAVGPFLPPNGARP